MITIRSGIKKLLIETIRARPHIVELSSGKLEAISITYLTSLREIWLLLRMIAILFCCLLFVGIKLNIYHWVSGKMAEKTIKIDFRRLNGLTFEERITFARF